MRKLRQAASPLLPLLAALSLLPAPAAAAAEGASRAQTTLAGGSHAGLVTVAAAAPLGSAVPLGSVAPGRASSLEAAASRAGETGRKVAMSLIGLAFAVASIVLAFRRDFKEAAGVFAVGLLSVLLATPAGVSLLKDTVKALVG